MEDQVYLPGFEPTEYKERSYLESILPSMASAVENSGGDSSILSLKSNKSGYSVVFYGVLTIFRLGLRGKQNYISIPAIYADLIPASWPKKRLKSETKYIRIPLDNISELDNYTDVLISLAGAAVNRYPKDWDCCSRYMECSDAKTCVHPDKKVALSCGYRRILNTGKVFYGKNRNV